MQNMPIGIFRGDDTDAFSYQTIVGTINTDLDLTGCKAVFRYLGFSMEFDPIPEDKKLTIIIPADETKKFPPGLGYASLRIYDSEGRLKTFSNRIMVFVATKTPMFGGDEFEVDFNVKAKLEPLRFFVGPNPDDFDDYRGYVEKVIDRASATKYGLAILLDAIDSDLGANDGVAATPVAVKAAYAAIIEKLTDDYYTAAETDEAIDRVSAYYITYTATGAAFPTYAALAGAQTVYSGGEVRIPTRNDYCVVLADETHGGSEYRYIYAVAEGETTGSWQPQFPVGGVMTVDQTVTKNSANPVSSGGIWSAIWGALSALPTGFTSLYDWCVAQLAGKASKSDATLTPCEFGDWSFSGTVPQAGHSWSVQYVDTISPYGYRLLSKDSQGIVSVESVYLSENDDATSLSFDNGTVATRTVIGYQLGSQDDKPLASEVEAEALRTGKQDALTTTQLANIEAVPGKLDKSGGTVTGDLDIGPNSNYSAKFEIDPSGGVTLTLCDSVGNTLVISGGKLYFQQNGWQAGVELFFPSTDGTLALAAANPTNGNLAALDAQGNPTDSLIPAANVAVKSNIPYDLVTKTIANGEVTLDDRASNAVTISATLSPNTLTVNFPTATTTGKVRDFALRLDLTSGVTAPELAWPQGVTLENDGGEVPEIADGGTGGSSTILYFSETATNKFLVKGETLTAIAQA